ncbi:YacL family protein [Vibrio rumoiensis]|uniref:YacL family protein n=1 Tax=Vibrio rumoiensis TaxID=76258 RepID=A0ABW7IVC7_9VIBR|nr:YacL family protein [Vibrio rumoiensis]
MDFEFKKNTLDGSYRVVFSSGHEAIGHWLIEEVGSDIAKLDHVLLQVGAQRNINQEWRLLGQDWSLFLEQNEVHISSNLLLSLEDEQFDDDLSAYDEESESWCGIEDFEQVLHSWRAFIR